MAVLNNLKIGVKITAGYLIALLLMCMVSGVTIMQFNQVNAKVAAVTGPQTDELLAIEDLVAGIAPMRLAINQYMTYQRPEDLKAVASHPMALAQCERFFAGNPHLKRVPAEDTAGSVREMMERGDKHFGAIAGRRAAGHYGAVILQENIQDNAENFTRFVLLLPPEQAKLYRGADAKKISLAMRLAHKPGALLASLKPFANHGVNLLKIESRPIHGRPWEYQFYLDVEAEEPEHLAFALKEVAEATSELRVLGKYAAARR